MENESPEDFIGDGPEPLPIERFALVRRMLLAGHHPDFVAAHARVSPSRVASVLSVVAAERTKARRRTWRPSR